MTTPAATRKQSHHGKTASRISHEVAFGLAELGRCLFPPLIVLTGLSLALHLSLTLDWLPSPRPTWDLDQTIVTHQTTAAMRRHDASILLMGDSSGLMNIDALDLTELSGNEVLNLCSLSFIDLKTQAALLESYLKMNRAPDTLVLVLHPEALRRPSPSAYHVRLTLDNLAGIQSRRSAGFRDRLLWALGMEQMRGRLLSRWLPRPLPAEFGVYYGFTHDLWRHMDERRGSAIDPTRFDPETHRGSGEFRLADSMNRQCDFFRRHVPHETRLLVLTTPIHASLATRSTEATLTDFREKLGEWLDAEVVGALPVILPDTHFATTAHLNETAARQYTRMAAFALGAPKNARQSEDDAEKP